MNDNETTKVQVLISGTVQMVSFRYHTKITARKLQLAGWVRNIVNKEKQVEARFEGPDEKVREMLDWCRSNEDDGSPGVVSDVVPIPVTDEDSPFPFDEWDNLYPENS